MKERLKNWWNKPITRGDYVKMCLGCLGAYGALGVGTYIYCRHEQKKLYEFDDDTEEVNDDSENN